MRARNTSPALMCRSDAPRSTAALMIRSMSSVSCVLVDEVAERLPVRRTGASCRGRGRATAARTAPATPARRAAPRAPSGDARARLVGAQRLLVKDVEHRAAQPAALQKVGNRLLVHERAARDVHDDRARAAAAPAARAVISRLVSAVSGAASTSDVGARRARRPARRARPPTRSPAARPSSGRRRTPMHVAPRRGQPRRRRLPDPPGADDQHAAVAQLAQGRVVGHEERLAPLARAAAGRAPRRARA